MEPQRRGIRLIGLRVPIGRGTGPKPIPPRCGETEVSGHGLDCCGGCARVRCGRGARAAGGRYMPNRPRYPLRCPYQPPTGLSVDRPRPQWSSGAGLFSSAAPSGIQSPWATSIAAGPRSRKPVGQSRRAHLANEQGRVGLGVGVHRVLRGPRRGGEPPGVVLVPASAIVPPAGPRLAASASAAGGRGRQCPGPGPRKSSHLCGSARSVPDGARGPNRFCAAGRAAFSRPAISWTAVGGKPPRPNTKQASTVRDTPPPRTVTSSSELFHVDAHHQGGHLARLNSPSVTEAETGPSRVWSPQESFGV